MSTAAGAAMGVWGLDTGRPGEFAQVATLGHALGLGFERIRLPAGGVLPPPPRVLLSFGRSAQAALRLAAACSPRPLLVHLGTPGQTPITAFDLIIPMPQDDYPRAPNVLFLRLPLNGAGPAPGAAPDGAGGCTVIIGGTSRHFRLTRRAVRRLVRFGTRLAAANGEALRVVTSPRTPPGILAELSALSVEGRFALEGYGTAPFSRILLSGSRFVVTADSASMLAETCRTARPVWLFPLPGRPNLSTILQHMADRCLGPAFRHRLVRRGLVGGGTNFGRWHGALERLGYVRIAGQPSEAALRWVPAALPPDTDLADCRARILDMLAMADAARAGQSGRGAIAITKRVC